MTTGELDYDEIFHQQEGEEEIAFPAVSFILWIIFLVLIPVLLNNLLVSCQFYLQSINLSMTCNYEMACLYT